MSLSAYFIIISYLMVCAGLLAVSMTGIISHLLLFACALLVVISLVLSLKGRTINTPAYVWNILAVLILIVAIADYIYVSGSLIEASVRFLTILMMAKLFDLKTNRDHAVLYALTFFQLLAASAATINISFLFVLLFYILAGIWALTVFTLKKDCEERGHVVREAQKNILGPYFFLSTGGVALVSLLITVLLFFIIPRVGIGFFPREKNEAIRISGFSENIDIGDIGQIKLDPAVVMRVELPEFRAEYGEEQAPQLYFRGIAFDYYTGSSWRQTISEKTPARKGSDGIFRLSSEQHNNHESRMLEQVIMLEPLESNVLFAASGAVGIGGSFQSVIGDAMGSFYLPVPQYNRVQYKAYSTLSPVMEREIMTGMRDSSAYLQLPSGHDSVAALTREITTGLLSGREKAKAIEDYLKKNFRYTLNPLKTGGANPIEDFLLITREGYCEQYAAAMTVMLRFAGVPARLVTGFMKGEWNRFGNYYIVRARDAHSWVEAYITEDGQDNVTDSGWVMFDPTPPAEAAGTLSQGASLFTLYLDSMRWKWHRYVINFSLADQLKLAGAAEAGARSAMSGFSLNYLKRKAAGLYGSTAAIIAALLIACAALLIIIRSALRIHRRQQCSEAPQFYKEMLKILSKKGKVKKQGMTAQEFAIDTGLHEVSAVTEIYYRIRFGGYMTTDDDKKKIRMYLNRIKKIKLS